MRPVYIDIESHWAVDHSLTKMNPIEYVMHPKTEIQSIAIAVDDWPIDVFFGEDEIRHVFSKIDWSDSMIIAHNNAGFDALIAAWRFGLKPKAWGCTMSMARPFYGLTHGVSLKKVSEAMGLGVKGSLDEVNTKGKYLKDFTPDEIAKMKVYNKQDTHLCREIFKRLAPKLGRHEMQLIDLTIRMTVEPQFQADTVLLEGALEREIQRKEAALIDLSKLCGVHQDNMTRDQIAYAMKSIVMSQPQFAGLLQQLGAEVPMKESPSAVDADGNPKMIPALSKKDEGMEALLEYQDPSGDEAKSYAVQVAAATRLEVKSTQLETRLATFINVAKWRGGYLPMPLNYCGAEITWRMSGGMRMNVQNQPRVDPKHPKASDALRQSLVAPEGKIIVVVDSSNIELRVAHALAGQADTVEKLRNKEDLYCWFASSMYGREITKADDLERYLGKQAMLQLQFNASWKSFQNTARINSKGLVNLPDDEAKRIVRVWRDMFPMIADKDAGIWTLCERALLAMATGDCMETDRVGLCTTGFERINTPANHWIQYPNLRKSMKVRNGRARDEWVYGDGRHKAGIFGGKVYANETQHIARLIVMEQTLKLDKMYPVALSCHDEAVMVVDEEVGEQCKADAQRIFGTSPKWWPDLPLSSAADLGYIYSDAK